MPCHSALREEEANAAPTVHAGLKLRNRHPAGTSRACDLDMLPACLRRGPEGQQLGGMGRVQHCFSHRRPASPSAAAGLRGGICAFASGCSAQELQKVGWPAALGGTVCWRGAIEQVGAVRSSQLRGGGKGGGGGAGRFGVRGRRTRRADEMGLPHQLIPTQLASQHSMVQSSCRSKTGCTAAAISLAPKAWNSPPRWRPARPPAAPPPARRCVAGRKIRGRRSGPAAAAC